MKSDQKECLLRFNGLGRQYGRQWAIREASGEVREGDGIVCYGPNGAGKTTLLHLLAGLSRSQEGHSELFAERPFLIGHQPAFYQRLTAAENLKYICGLYGISASFSRIEEALQAAGLPVDRRPAGGFSRGMQQRLLLSAALLIRPDLLFLDEPFTGLDMPGQKMLLNILKKRGDENFDWRMKAFISVDHDPQRGDLFSNRVWLVPAGTLRVQSSKIGPSRVRDFLLRGIS